MDYSVNRTHSQHLLEAKEVYSDKQLDSRLKHRHPKLEVLDFSDKQSNNNNKTRSQHLTCLVLNQPSNLTPVLYLDNNRLKLRLQPRIWEVGLNQLKARMALHNLSGKLLNLLPLKYRQWTKRTKKKYDSLLNVTRAS
jgi:hypothetical protein